LEFHVEVGDYFGTLATLLDLLRQGIVKNEKKEKEILTALVGDLLYLQDHFDIVRK